MRSPRHAPPGLPVAALLVLLLSPPVAARNLGHRLGGDVYGPENTLHCYRQALEHLQDKPEFEYVEFDVQETLDGALVVFHDTHGIRRIVPSSPANLTVLAESLRDRPFEEIRIEHLTLEQVRGLRLDQDARIPTLEEVLNASVEWRLRKPMLIEIKSLRTDACRESLLALVARYRDSLRADFLCFPDRFRDSFPDPLRWKLAFRRAGFRVYTPLLPKTAAFDQVADAPRDRSKDEFRTVIDEREFRLGANGTRTLRIPLPLPPAEGTDHRLRVGIHHGYDDTGDRGVRVRLTDAGGRVRWSGFSRSRQWQWFETPLADGSSLTLEVEDLDTRVTGENPGNAGRVAATLVFARP